MIVLIPGQDDGGMMLNHCGPLRFKAYEGYFLVTSRWDMSTVIAAEDAHLERLDERDLHLGYGQMSAPV